MKAESNANDGSDTFMSNASLSEPTPLAKGNGPIVDCSNGTPNEPPMKKQKSENGAAVPVAAAPENTTPQSHGATADAQDSTEAKQQDESQSTQPPPIATEETETERRPRRTAAAVARLSVADATKPATTQRKKKAVQDTEEEFNTAWICCECKEAECMMHADADQLLICEGLCRRLFHYPCAGLSQPPAEEEAYVCLDCRTGRHVCAFCQLYGKDNEDVFPCCDAKCGLFFHEACLLMREVQVKLVPIESDGKDPASADPNDENADDERAVGTFRREFKCPAHACWTCCQTDMVEKEKKAAAEARKNEKKRGRKKTKPSNPAFGQKTGQMTMRCLVCPNSYHLTCIPPTARFNELSLVCPDHVSDVKLPDVDPETSLQTKIEKHIDAKLAKIESPSRRRGRKAYMKNPFFHGMSGKSPSKFEQELVSGFATDAELGPLDTLFYCMPCNLRDEVYAKPPSYRHMHANRVTPGSAPSPIKPQGGTCNCKYHCDEACINRLLYVECTKDVGVSGTNCAVGKHCGNRQLGQKKFKKCKPKRERGKGWGLVVQEDVKKGELLLEYVGEVINEKTKQERLLEWAKEHPNDPNFYIMGLGKGWYLDARNEANLARFINHSCDPNAIVHTINVNGYLRNAIYALHDIRAGTFLCYDYHFETMQGDRFVCRCGSPNCRGTMKDKNLATDDAEKSKGELWEAAKREYDRDKAFLEDFYAKRAERQSQVDAMVPEWEFPSDLVANGPQNKHHSEAIRGRLFLCRNTRLGGDFIKRFARLEKSKEESKEAKSDN